MVVVCIVPEKVFAIFCINPQPLDWPLSIKHIFFIFFSDMMLESSQGICNKPTILSVLSGNMKKRF